MKLPVFTISAALLAAVLAASPAAAFTEEPIAGTGGLGGGGGNRFLDPDQEVPRLGDPAPGGGAAAGERSPFSFGITGPGMQGGPSVNRPGADNRNLYWNNTTNRHEAYGRNSTSNRNPHR